LVLRIFKQTVVIFLIHVNKNTYIRLIPSDGQCFIEIITYNVQIQFSTNLKHCVMPKYVIEREIPGAGELSAEQLKAISQTSCGVLSSMGPQIQWVTSYVTADKIYCVYIAPNEEMVREHADQGGFPANSVSEVMAVIDPVSAE
jgi:hypothetical protein